MDAMNSRQEREARSVREQAAEWLLILEEGNLRDRETFAAWLRKSPLNIGAFLRAATMDALLTRVDPGRTVKVVRYIDAEDSDSLHPELLRGRRVSWRWATAACVALMAVTSISWWLRDSRHNDSQRVTTATGEQRVLELADGSALHLNTSSAVSVRFTEQERRVDLLSGEALFRIQRDASRPFRVHSGRAVIEAIGTQFNVYRRRDDAVVSVLEGAVRVSNERGLASSPLPVRLDAGEQARVSSDGSISQKSAADVSRVSAWRQRRLIFRDEPLASIAAEFNRYNRTPKIRVEDERVGARHYAAAFDADDPESLLGILGKDPALEVENRGDELVIRSRQSQP